MFRRTAVRELKRSSVHDINLPLTVLYLLSELKRRSKHNSKYLCLFSTKLIDALNVVFSLTLSRAFHCSLGTAKYQHFFYLIKVTNHA